MRLVLSIGEARTFVSLDVLVSHGGGNGIYLNAVEVRMRRLRLVLWTLLLLAPTAPSYAGGGHGGTSVVIGFGGFGCCFGGFGFGGFWPPYGWGYAPPPAWAYAPPAYAGVPPPMAMSPAATAAPAALAAPHAQSPSAAAPPATEAVWYYCPTTKGYYPYVANCAVAWQTVPTTPPTTHLVHAPTHVAPAPIAPERPTRGVGATPTEAFWHGVGGSPRGEPKLVAEFNNSSGQPCQELEHTVVVDGIHRRATAVVCERPDGHWMIATQTARAAAN